MGRLKTSINFIVTGLLCLYTGLALSDTVKAPINKNPQKHIILFIWDGLRPDSISTENTPNLEHIKQTGVWFSDNHSTYPTLTMMNAASFATGSFSGKTGFYGNILWNPRASGNNAEGKPVDYKAPVFTEDYKILQNMDQPNKNDPIFFINTLFEEAHQAGISTSTIGKSGPAFIQNYREEAGMRGIVMDEKHVYPADFAKLLKEQAFPLPQFSVLAFNHQIFSLPKLNGTPTAFGSIKTLRVISGAALGLQNDFMYPDNVTPDPSATDLSPYSQSNAYLMRVFLNKILTIAKPTLSVVWLRNPDTTEHNYGVGSPSYYTALRDQDQLLGKLLEQIKALGIAEHTDIIIASDHSHSNVSGPLRQFPLRLIHHGVVSVQDAHGYSSSGDFRPADLLARAGFHAYDGQGCSYDPVLSGIKSNGSLVYPIRTDKENKVCGENSAIADSYGHRNQRLGHIYTSAPHLIPKKLPQDAIIVAGNGGSTYFYLPNHNKALVEKVVRYLQSRQEFDAIFVDNRYSTIPGALPMSLAHIRNPQGRNPDIIVGSSYDDHARISGISGIEFNSGGIDRGMHGSFSHIDVHNTLLAIGPDFKSHFVDPLPSGNVDVPVTIAYLLNLKLPHADGRPLLEALNHGLGISDYTVVKLRFRPEQPAVGLKYQLATNPDGKDIDPSKTRYSEQLRSKLLMVKGKTYQYFDSAKAKRF